MQILKTGWLRQARRKKHLTLKQAADAIGKDCSTLWRYENGKLDISTSVLLQLTALYGISVDQVLQQEE